MSLHKSHITLLIAGWLTLTLAFGGTRTAAAAEDSQAEANPSTASAEAVEQDVTQGALRIVQKNGSVVECPLKHTDVRADVSGFIARVDVTQTFENPTNDVIEAVYVFPLPHQAAVDNMTMVIGQRKIVGVIKRRAEARQIYEQALLQGQTAALLEQERPNIFTQSVGNIGAGQEVRIEISYVDVLKYDIQEYEFYFPMVVGPRFNPGQPSGGVGPNPPELQGKVSPPVANTTRVPDAQRISPPVLRPEVRNGHDISMTVTIDAGVPVENLRVTNHQADVERDGASRAVVKLRASDSVPNKDFVVRYDVVGTEPEIALLAHTGEYSKDATRYGDGYFMLMVQPKEDERLLKSPPREIVFLVDVSGSMRGDKTAKTVDAMKQMLGHCREIDTVQVITFASRANKLFEKPLPVNEASIQRALHFADQIRGSGGTHMLQGVKMAIDQPIDNKRIRIVVMLTDGFIGNEAEIIEHVGKECGDHVRFWAVGIGQSPNMFLVDGVARQGGGMGKRLGLNDETEVLATEIMTRIQRAQLAQVKVDWGGAAVVETYPARIPELWAGRPVVVYGRFSGSGRHEIVVSGLVEGEAARWPLTINLPDSQPKHAVLAKVWARQRIEDLMQQAYYADSPAIEEEVTAIALDYRLMSQYTSFVAVDESQAESTITPARPPRRMLVPVPLPEGAQWEGFFGADGDARTDRVYNVYFSKAASPAGPMSAPASASMRGLRRTPARRSVALGRLMEAKTFAPASPSPVRLSGLSLGTSYSRRGALSESESLRRFRGGMAGFGSGMGGGMGGGGMGGGGMGGGGMGGGGMGGGGMGGGGVGGGGVGRMGFAPGNYGASSADGLARGWSYAALSIVPQDGRALQEVQEAVKASKEHEDSADSVTRETLVRALFLARAMTNVGQPDGGAAANALTQLMEAHKKQVADWQKAAPVLSERLDLVLRDQSVADSLKQIATAAGIDISLVPDSVEDVERLLGTPPRVTYLDLRGASLAEALDWVLQPQRLTWRLDDDKIVAGSERRLPGRSAWVYDVSRIALPSTEELKELGDEKKTMEFVQTAGKRFMSIVVGQLEAHDDKAVFWFGPGQLLVFGDPQRHQAALELLSDLSDAKPKNRLAGEAGKLQLVTRKRAAATQEESEQRTAMNLQAQIAMAHMKFGWQLLASAIKGQLDDEAITELSTAWHSPVTLKLAQDEGRPLVLRSLWLVTEASRAMPGESQLAELAATAMKQTRPFIEKTLASGEMTTATNTPADRAAIQGLLFAALALPEGDELRFDCTKGLMSVLKDQPAIRLIAEALLKPAEGLDAAQLAAVLNTEPDENLLVLAALACRDAGPEAWEVYRHVSRDILSHTPVPGSVVVLINNMAP